MSDLHEALRASQSDTKTLSLLRDFSLSLQALSFPHRVAEDKNDVVIWVFQDEHISQCQQLFQRFIDGELASSGTSRVQESSFSFNIIYQLPVVIGTLILCCMGFSLLFVESWYLMSLLSFQGLSVEAGELVVNSRETVWDLLQQGQLWRLITPIFLHFGVIHLAFNAVLFLYFAKQIERREGSFNLFSDILLLALMSNVAQFCFMGAQLFGGLSGVVYGLMAYCWGLNFLQKNSVYDVPKGLMPLSVVMIFLGFSGIFSIMSLSMANWAHLMGLLTGFALAVIRK